jgi:hypothetical protein
MKVCEIPLNIFTFLEKHGKACCKRTTYFFLLILNPGHTYNEVKCGKMHVPPGFKSKFEDDKNATVESARAYFEEEVKRSQVIDEKNKVLLTITALLIAADAAIASSIEPKWLILFPFIPTVISIFLILVHFGIQTIPIPEYGKKNEELIKSYFDCMKKYSQANCFRVGIYLAACRATTIGVLLLLVVFIYFPFSKGSSFEDKLMNTMQNNTESIKRLRALQGSVDPNDECGVKGPQVIQDHLIAENNSQLTIQIFSVTDRTVVKYFRTKIVFFVS